MISYSFHFAPFLYTMLVESINGTSCSNCNHRFKPPSRTSNREYNNLQRLTAFLPKATLVFYFCYEGIFPWQKACVKDFLSDVPCIPAFIKANKHVAVL